MANSAFRIVGWARFCRIAAACIFLSLAGLAAAVERPDQTPDPVTVYRDAVADTRPGGPAGQLMQRALEQGTIRVIVGLRIVTRMEHTLSAAQVAQQRRGQRVVEDGVLSRVLGAASAPGVVRFEFIPYLSMFVDAEQLGRLLADPQVVSIQEDRPARPLLSQSIPLIHAPEVFAAGLAGANFLVAVLDTGVAKTHPMFAGKIVSEACYSTNTGPRYASFCPGGVPASVAAGSAVNCPVAVEDCDHGTHVTSIAAGNSSKYDGVGRDARIIAIQVFSHDTSTNEAVSFETDQIEGLKRVFRLRNAFSRMRIASVNMSIGSDNLFRRICDRQKGALKAAIDNLRGVGIVTVAASGNDSSDDSISSPACISTAIAVGNTEKSDLIAPSSNHSPLVKLMAPGTNIKAAVPAGAACIDRNGPHCAKTGTSMAAPHVAGAFAVLRRAPADYNAILEALTCSGKVVNHRPGELGPERIDPARPRIDLLGAFAHLRKPRNFTRAWDFVASREALDWSPFNGDWAVQGGTYAPRPPLSGLVSSSMANCNTSLEVVARLRRVDPSPPPALYKNGVWLKTTIDYENSLISGYYFFYDRNLSPVTGERGSAGVLKADRLSLITGSCVGTCSFLCHGEFIPIALNGFNTVRVVSRGASHTFHLNGEEACAFNDATFATGAVMVAAETPGDAGHTFDADSLSVRSLDVAAPAEDVDPVMDPAVYLREAAEPAWVAENGGRWIKPRRSVLAAD